MASGNRAAASALETPIPTQEKDASLPLLTKKSWATRAEQWESHYMIISHLYLVAYMPLKDVVKYMSEQYDFHATEKQYKHRLKGWGIRKNLTSREVQEAWHSAASRQNLELPTVQGRQLGSQKLKSFIVRKSSPPTNQPDFPDNIKATHHALSAIKVYSNHRFEKTSSANDEDFGGDRTRFWWIEMMLAASKIQDGCSPANAFKVIDDCCAQYQHLLKKDDTLLVYCTYAVMIKLASAGEDLAMLFSKYITELCSIVLGPRHPISCFWASLQSLGISEARNALRPIMKAYFDVVHKNTALGSQVNLVAARFLSDFQHSIAPVDQKQSLRGTLSSIDKLRHNPSLAGKYLKYWKTWAWVLPSLMSNDIEGSLGSQYSKMFDQSDLSIPEEELLDDFLEFDIMPVIAMMEELHGRYLSAEWHYKYVLDLATQKYQKGHPRISKAYDWLEQCKRRQAGFRRSQAA